MAAVSSGWGPKLKGKLADYANASKGTVLLGDIQAHMIKEHSKPSTRRQDVIHPSEMAKTGWCPRSTYYRIQACRDAKDPFLKPAESVSVQLLNIFAEGHMIHDKWQRRLWEMGRLYGNWQCQECMTYFNNLLSPTSCSECHSQNLIYREVPLKAKQYLISGHADGAIPDLNSLIEIKSVGAGTVRIEAPDIYEKNSDGQYINLQNLWKDITVPFPAHIRQGQLYLALCRLAGLPYDQIIFIYEAKFNQGVKEFAVKYDPKIGDELLLIAREIVNALDANGPIPQCPTGTCKDCENYGTQKYDSERVGNVCNENRVESTSQAIRRPAGASRRLVRPS